MAVYNPRFWSTDGSLKNKKAGMVLTSFRQFTTQDGVIIGLFQGDRGARKDLDFVVRFLNPGLKMHLRTPQHKHWVVSLLIMRERHPELVARFLDECVAFYASAKAFESHEERQLYQPVLPSKARSQYRALNTNDIYSIETISYFVEFFAICERATPVDGKKMYAELLKGLVGYCKGVRDFYQVINMAAPGH